MTSPGSVGPWGGAVGWRSPETPEPQGLGPALPDRVKGILSVRLEPPRPKSMQISGAKSMIEAPKHPELLEI